MSVATVVHCLPEVNTCQVVNRTKSRAGRLSGISKRIRKYGYDEQLTQLDEKTLSQLKDLAESKRRISEWLSLGERLLKDSCWSGSPSAIGYVCRVWPLHLQLLRQSFVKFHVIDEEGK
jgi:hypothetical protein